MASLGTQRRKSVNKKASPQKVSPEDLEEPFFESQYHYNSNSELDSLCSESSPTSPVFSSGNANDEDRIGTVELPLHVAVKLNDTAQVSFLLESLPNLTRSVDAQARTALHIACKLGYVQVAEIILRTCYNINAPDCTGKSYLHYCDNADLCSMLLDAGSNPNLQDDQGNTPLHLVTMTGNTKCVRVLLAWGANPTITDSARARSVVHIAVDVGNPELLACILHESKFEIYLDSPDCDGNAAIHIAAMSSSRSGQQQKLITLLLDRGASVLVLNNRLISPLHYVCANRFLCSALLAEPLVEIILDQGASPNAMDCDGCTPLVIAATHREWGICRLLLEAGGDLNVPCPMNSYLLQHGVAFNSARDSFLKQSDCTASDLLPRKARAMLFQYICVPQTFIPAERRDRCMNCGEQFGSGPTAAGTRSTRTNTSMNHPFSSGNDSPSSRSSASKPAPSSSSSMVGSLFTGSLSSMLQSFSLSSGKHHCRMCNRVVCQDCSSNYLDAAGMPDFILESGTRLETSYRVCKICFGVLTAKRKPSIS